MEGGGVRGPPPVREIERLWHMVERGESEKLLRKKLLRALPWLDRGAAGRAPSALYKHPTGRPFDIYDAGGATLRTRSWVSMVWNSLAGK